MTRADRQVKQHDSRFDDVSVRQLRKAISAANKSASSQVASSMEVEQTFQGMYCIRTCQRWCSSVKSRRRTGWHTWNAWGLRLGIGLRPYTEECQEWRIRNQWSFTSS